MQLYGSFFPVCRVSNAAVKFLHKRRLEHKEVFEKLDIDETTKWIFSETFVPTELCNNGFTADTIDEPNVTLHEWDLTTDRLFESPDNLLYHSVKGNFISRIKSLKAELSKYK